MQREKGKEKERERGGEVESRREKKVNKNGKEG